MLTSAARQHQRYWSVARSNQDHGRTLNQTPRSLQTRGDFSNVPGTGDWVGGLYSPELLIGDSLKGDNLEFIRHERITNLNSIHARLQNNAKDRLSLSRILRSTDIHEFSVDPVWFAQ